MLHSKLRGMKVVGLERDPKAPTGRDTIAQGNALGPRMPTAPQALKGRNKQWQRTPGIAPLQGLLDVGGKHSRGVAPGYSISPRWG